MPNLIRKMSALLFKNYCIVWGSFLFLLSAACFQSCKEQPAPTNESKTLFYTMGVSVPDFLKTYQMPDFKGLNLQFQNTGLNKQGNFQFDFYDYIGKEKPDGSIDYVDAGTFIQPVPGRENYSFETPYSLGNIEVTKEQLDGFFKRLDSLGTGINKYDSIVFIPYQLDKKFASLYILPIKAGQPVNRDSLPPMMYLTGKPCPPSCDGKGGGGVARAIDEVKHVH